LGIYKTLQKHMKKEKKGDNDAQEPQGPQGLI